MQLDFSKLADEVAAEEGAQASAVTLINKLAAEVSANKNDPVALQAFVDRLTAARTPLADAVAANPGV
jgi:hypothetical protein